MLVYWVIFYALFLVILAIFAYVFRNSFVRTANYGTFATPVLTSCVNGHGTEVIICVPNPSTHLGCLLPDNSQTFRPQVSQVPCTVIEPGAIWQTVYVGECRWYTGQNQLIPPMQCIAVGSDALRQTPVTQQCVATTTPSGPNQCILADGLTAVAGQEQLIYQPCFTALNPGCGTFSKCVGQLPYVYAPPTAVLTYIAPPFNLFHEGVLTDNTQPCVYDTPSGPRVQDPPYNGPATTYCVPFTGPCRALPPPLSVATKTLPNPDLQDVCNINHVCLTVARVYPGLAIGLNSNLLTFYNKPFVLLVNNQIVTINPTTGQLALRANTTPCSGAAYVMTNALLIWLSPTTSSTGAITARLMGLVGPDIFGWLTLSNGFVHFNPAPKAYLNDTQTAPQAGLTYVDATIMTVSYQRTTAPSGYPAGTVAVFITINGAKLENGQPITNMLAYILPTVYDLMEPYILARTVDNPCYQALE